MAWIELHQELREHRKIYACAEILKISRIAMVGTIVSLWLWALDNMPDGSLHGISNRTIARVCGFPERKADSLVKALTDTGWLDNTNGILSIHDWSEYTGKLMDRRKKDRDRKRKSAQSLDGFQKNSSGIPMEFHKNSCATVQYSTNTVQNHTDSTHNTETVIDAPEAPAPHSGKPFTVFWDTYPSKIDREGAWQAWKDLNPDPETVDKILSALDAWKKSSQWTEDGGRFVPNAAKFLNKGYWQSPPSPESKGTIYGATGTLGQAELDAIRRVLKEE